MTFTDDLRAALRVWRAAPLLPLVFVGIYLAPLAPFPPMWTIVSPAVFVFWAGWLGAERIWYLRLFRGRDFPVAEALSMTWRFLGRYLLLGIVMGIPAGAIYALGIWAAGGTRGAQPNDPLIVVAGLVAFLAIGMAMTFVAPALAFTTRRVRTAWHVGYRMLIERWPGTAPYALIPPICIAVATYVPELLAQSAWPSRVGWAIVTALVASSSRGAIVAYYLRHAEVPDDGAAFGEAPRPDLPAIEDPAVPASIA